MNYLLDTNVISEVTKRQQHQNVVSWLRSIDAEHLYISVITLGEIRKGLEKLSDIPKKNTLLKWLEIDLQKEFSGRIVNIDGDVADKWGYISAQYRIPAIDGLIAASALVYNLKLVTRNVKDFENVPGLELINPWDLG